MLVLIDTYHPSCILILVLTQTRHRAQRKGARKQLIDIDVKCIESRHVLWIMWMAHPNQADRPQGSHHVSDGILAANDLGIGSGWQQSKQN